QGQDLDGRCLRHGDQRHQRTPLLQIRRAHRDRGAEDLSSASGRGRRLPIRGRMTRMASRLRLHSLVVALVVLGLGTAWLDGARPAEAAPTRLPAWTGGVNLYRNGTF